MEALWNGFAGQDSPGTALANVVTILGVFGGLILALHISGTFSASLSLTARLLQTMFKLTGGAIVQERDELPPGDQSRVFYEAYAISRSWSERYWTGHIPLGTLSSEDLAAYEVHVDETLFLLDRVLRHAPSPEARVLWANKVNVHVYAHGHLLKRPDWRWLKLRRYSLAMQKLIAQAPNPRAPARAAAELSG